MGSERRWFPFWLWIFSLLWLFGTVLGCSGVTVSAPSTSAPFFIATAEDTTRAGILSHDLDNKALHCMEVADCEQVYFERALVSLFEDQEAARASFRHVIEHNAASPLSMPSRLWLEVIEKDTGALDRSPSTTLMEHSLREWMERQVTQRTIPEKRFGPVQTQGEAFDHSKRVLGLQKQLRERDHQVTVLRAQLEALKFIDEEHQEKQRKVKMPASLRPTEEYVGK